MAGGGWVGGLTPKQALLDYISVCVCVVGGGGGRRDGEEGGG